MRDLLFLKVLTNQVLVSDMRCVSQQVRETLVWLQLNDHRLSVSCIIVLADKLSLVSLGIQGPATLAHGSLVMHRVKVRLHNHALERQLRDLRILLLAQTPHSQGEQGHLMEQGLLPDVGLDVRFLKGLCRDEFHSLGWPIAL